jgi:hypothetical protein
MSIEAPYSKYCKTNFKIAIIICLGLAIIFAYDGYISKYKWSFRRGFYDQHVKDGILDSTMAFNRMAPLVLVPVAAILIAWLRVRENSKILADENELILPSTSLRIGSANEKIPYDSIEKIDRTYFTSKGYFAITYKNKEGVDVNRVLSARKYDNLEAILDLLVEKITGQKTEEGRKKKN